MLRRTRLPFIVPSGSIHDPFVHTPVTFCTSLVMGLRSVADGLVIILLLDVHRTRSVGSRDATQVEVRNNVVFPC